MTFHQLKRTQRSFATLRRGCTLTLKEQGGSCSEFLWTWLKSWKKMPPQSFTPRCNRWGRGWHQAFLTVELWEQRWKIQYVHITMPLLLPCQHNHTWGKPTHFTGDGDGRGIIMAVIELLKQIAAETVTRGAEVQREMDLCLFIFVYDLARNLYRPHPVKCSSS